MPTYQYRCKDCGKDLEVFQKFTDEALTDCPACHGRLRKVFSPVGVVFKGSGFYATDNRTKGAGAAAAGSNATGNNAAGSGDTSASPAKPAAPAPESSGPSSTGSTSSS